MASSAPPIDDFLALAAGHQAMTIPGLLWRRHEQTPNAHALWELDATETWRPTSWAEFAKQVLAVASGLRRLGLRHGDRVGIMAPSSQTWDCFQVAIMAAGGVAVGLDPHGLDEHIQEIAQQCEFAGIVFGNARLESKLGPLSGSLRFRITLENDKDESFVTGASLLASGTDQERQDDALPDDLATIIFTSGTTGAPKGIAYTHRQICLAVSSILSGFPSIGEGSHLICWLPLSNLFQRMINFCGVARGAEIYYVPDPKEIMRLAPSAAPDLFIAVPRFYEKLYAGIQDNIRTKPAPLQALIHWATALGRRWATCERKGLSPEWSLRIGYRLADLLVLRKLRALLGPNLRFLVSGSAPMPLWLLEEFHAMGFLILEAYGLSENVIPVALNRPDAYRLGTVGRSLPGCEVTLAEDGELLVRGPGVLAGYYHESLSESPRRADGFLPSGDFASIDDQGYISLIGRKSDIFKTSTGRRIAPAGIECHLRQVSLADQVVVFGAGRAQLIAVISVAPDTWEKTPDLCTQLRSQLRHAVSPLPSYQQPGGFVALKRVMTIDGGELTANLKLRRRNIEAKYSAQIDRLYQLLAEKPGASFELLAEDGSLLYCSL